MNPPASTARPRACATPLALALPLMLLLAGCDAAAPSPQSRPPLEGARIGGPFTLVDGSGRTVTDRDFAGRYRLVYFGYSFCPDVCPVDLNRLMLGLKLFERQDAARAARVQPIFITIDPERDTPAVLARYVANFHPRLVGLTGTPAQVRAAADAYAVTYARQPGGNGDAYLMGHSNIAYLMGPAGEPLAILPVDDVHSADVDEGAPARVAAELALWVR